MKKETWDYIKKFYPNFITYSVLSFVLAILSIIGLLLFVNNLENIEKTNISFIPFLIPILIICYPIFFYIYILEKIEKEFFKEFSKEYGLSLETDEDTEPEDIRSSFIKSRNDRGFSNIMSGKYNNSAIRIFDFCTNTAGKGHSREYCFTVLERQYDGKINLILDSRFVKSFFDISPDNPYYKRLSSDGELKLEGNFNDYFNVYYKDGYEIEALQILTPDIMEKLIEKSNKYNLEFAENKLYIYALSEIKNKEEMQEMLNLSDYIFSKLSHKIPLMNS